MSYYPNIKTCINWYLDIDLCKQIDNVAESYTVDKLKNMYNFLNKNGYVYYIKYDNRLCGDVTLQRSGEISIVISKEYQNKHIGRLVVGEIENIAKDLSYNKLIAKVYNFNNQSLKMFRHCGFNTDRLENNIYHLLKEI
jgi:RimJ/RimL family protein N-acetyltransferase